MPNWNARGWPLEKDPEPALTRVKYEVVLLMGPGAPDKVPSSGPAKLSLLKILKTSIYGSTDRRSLNFQDQLSRTSEVKKPGLFFSFVGTLGADSMTAPSSVNCNGVNNPALTSSCPAGLRVPA